MSFQNCAEFILEFFALANATVASLSGVSNIAYSISFQPLPQIITSKSDGTNVLGLTAADGDLVNILSTLSWDEEEDDAVVEDAAKCLFENAGVKAEEMGVSARYIYLNYAAKWQDPIGGYGEKERAFLQYVSEAWDPSGMFQHQVPGGFKLWSNNGSGY